MKSKIKNMIGLLVEIISGRRCKRCRYNGGFFCKRLDSKGDKCREKLYPYGYERR